MAFIETPRLPLELSAWARGGPEFHTAIGMAGGGAENRNIVWSYPLCKWDIGQGAREVRNANITIAFHRAAAGSANGFRMQDPFDNACDVTNGIVGPTGLGTGLPSYQLYKSYAVGGSTPIRKISKPVAGSPALLRAGSPVVAGAGAGQIALDSTTGGVVFVADSSSAVTALAVGATTSVTLGAALAGLTVGGALYLSGCTGADAALLNGLAHTVTAISGGGSNVYTLSTNTAGKTIAVSGTGFKYPQPTEALVWAGSFDVPVRFDVDWLQLSMDQGGLLNYDSIILRELRL